MKPTVLIAESDRELCDIFRKFLTKAGYEVATAADGLDCLGKLRQQMPAVLVLDLELRWGGGEGVLAWLREEDVGSTVSVILTTTAASPAPFVEEPVVQILFKPFALTALLKSVRDAIAPKECETLFGLDRAALPDYFLS